MAKEPLSLHPERVIIEIPGGIAAEEAVLRGIRTLRERGHHIALDDFAPHVSYPAVMELVDIVKVPLPAFAPAQLARLAPELIHRGLKLIAKNVATIEQFEHASQLGFDGFQGDFLTRPPAVPLAARATQRLRDTASGRHRAEPGLHHARS